MRLNLKEARKGAGLTQQQVADKVVLSLRQYQRLEDGTSKGTIEVWDALEDLFQVHQRKLREIQDIHTVPGANP